MTVDAAKALSEEIWEGKWDHLQEVESVPIGQWAEMAKELERRCPGHTLQEYRDAICREMVKH